MAACAPPKADMRLASTTEERGPLIAWAPIAGATAYRVKLLSRVPNGRILAMHDAVVTEPRFLAPRPLADYRAKVTLRLAAICGKETSAESVMWFMIDTSSVCSDARNVEKRAHTLSDGRFIAEKVSRATPHVQSTHPLCVNARGEATYRVTTGD